MDNNSWFHRFISIDEVRVSVLVIILLCFVVIDIYSVVVYKEIPQNLANITMMTIGTIGGVNAISFMGNNLMANRTGQQQNMQMPYQNNMYGGMNNMNGMYGNGNMYGMNNYSTMFPSNSMSNMPTNPMPNNPVPTNVPTPATTPITRQDNNK